MILVQKTEEEFGYDPTTLTKGSKKKLYVKCDYCSKEYTVVNKNRVNGNSIVDKDGCMKCRQKKKEDVVKAKYGVSNVAQLQSTISTRKQTCQERYGADSYVETQEFVLKRDETNREKYGGNPMSNEDIKNRHKQSIREKYGVDNVMQVKSIAKNAGEKSRNTKLNNGQIKTYQNKDVEYWRTQAGFSKSHFNKLINRYGWEQAIDMTPNMSSLEVDMENILKEIDVEYEKQFRIDTKYADFKVGNILIECDGLYWHSEENVDKNYHRDKRDLYIKHGYSPLFFRENEIRDTRDIVKSIIINRVNKSKRVFARKCEVVYLTSNQSTIFFNNNHLMGSGRGITIGLIHNGEIISAMQFLCKKKKDGIYEVSRFCNKLNHSVVGGYSRLLARFEKDVKYSTLFSFTDLRYGTGQHMGKFGFGETTNFLSFKWTDGFNTWNRMKFPGNRGREIGLVRIYDCGQLKYLKKC